MACSWRGGFAAALPFLLLGPTLAATPLPPPQPAVTRLSRDTDTRWVPFTLTGGNQIRFAMRLDGHNASAILDTGVSRSVVSRRFAAGARLRVAAGGKAAAIGGEVTIDKVTVSRIEIGGMIREGGGLSVVSLPVAATGSDGMVDLLVGQDLIGRMALDIDYANSRFRLLPSGRLPFHGATAPLSIAPGLDLYVTELRIGHGRQRPMMLDTGDGATVTLSREAWRNAGVAMPASTTTIAYGIAGPLVTELTVLPRLQLGGLTARDVELRIEPEGGYSHGIGVAGRIGNGLLQRYRVLLDPGAGRAVFAATGATDQPPLKSTSGVQALTEPGRLRVVHVMRGSPADMAGWHAGDLVCAVDGQTIGPDYEHTSLARWTVGEPGRIVALGMCSGEQRRLVLHAFY